MAVTMSPDLALQWATRLRHFSGPFGAFSGLNPGGGDGDHTSPCQEDTLRRGGFSFAQDVFGTGIKREPQIREQQPGQLKAWESWQSEDCGTSSSATSSNASSLSLPMQETWDDILAQMPSADAAPMLWQSQFDARAEQSMATSTAPLPGPIASCMDSPFADIDTDDLTDMLLPPLPGQQTSSGPEADSDGAASGEPAEQAAQTPLKARKAITRTRAEQRARRRQQQKVAQQRYRERQRVWMSEGEARMEELSAQFREVKVAHDELVGRKASLQADVATLELALAKADAEAAAVRERLATPPQPAAKAVVTAAHGVLLDKAAEAARQRRIFAALDMTPMQAQTLLWARERQLARMTTIAEGREVISMQVLSQMGPALQPAAAAPDGLLTGVAAEYGLPVLTGIVELYAAIEALQANTAEAQRVLTVLDDLVVVQVLSPLQRAVLVVESVPAAPDTLALVDTVAGTHGGTKLTEPQLVAGLAVAA